MRPDASYVFVCFFPYFNLIITEKMSQCFIGVLGHSEFIRQFEKITKLDPDRS